MGEGSLLTNGSRPAVRLQRHLADPPAVVWKALTEREQLQRWFPCEVILPGGAWVVGATLTFPFDPDVIDMTLTGRVLHVEEPFLLAYTWGEETLRFELRMATDGGTDLVLLDELPPSAAARNAAGWEECLDRLVGEAPPGDGWQTHFARYAARFEPVLGPQDGPPAEYKGD